MLELRGISKSFGGIQALHQINLQVERGEILAIIGPNGAGKTTLINLMSGQIPADEGEIIFDGKVVTSLLPHAMAQLGIGRTFQNLELFYEMTVLENVIVGCHLNCQGGVFQAGFGLPPITREEKMVRDRAGKVLGLVGLADKADLNVDFLSAGQQRILEIARALAQDPTYLLLDEPFAGLSAQECRNLGQTILARKEEGIGIILIEHNMDMVMSLADRIAVIDYGILIACGLPDEIINEARVISAYLGEGI